MKKLGRYAPDVLDLHVYGGALLLAIGAGLWNLWAGPAVFGLILLGLGLTR